MKNEPCAKLTIRVTPKISVRPAATRNSDAADARPFSSWTASDANDTSAPSARGRTQALHDGVGRQVILAVGVMEIDHHALAVTNRKAPDERAHRRLVVDRTERHVAERRRHVE